MTITDIANFALAKIGTEQIRNIDDATVKEAIAAKLLYAQALDEVLRAHFWGFAMTTVDIGVSTTTSTESVIVSGVISPTTANGVYLRAGNWQGKPLYVRAAGNPSGDWLQWNGVVGVGGTWRLQVSSTTRFDSTQDVATPDLVRSWTAQNGSTGYPTITIAPTLTITPWSTAFLIPKDFLKLKEIRSSWGQKIDKFEIRRASGLGQRCILTRIPDSETASITVSYVQRVTDPNEWDPLFTAALVTLLASKIARNVTGGEQLESTLRQTYLLEDLPAARCADGHDSQSAENHPLQDILDGTLTGRRSNYLPDFD